MIHIQHKNISDADLDTASLIEAARQAFDEEGVEEDVDLTILLSDDAEVQALNRDYRGYDKPTDVLSFEAHERDPETGILYLGDIIISRERAAEQAEKGRASAFGGVSTFGGTRCFASLGA
jgi:probable rRNA maturation factor